MARSLDYIVYITYDLHGQWDYDNKWTSSGFPSGNCLKSHINDTETNLALSMITKAGVPSNKIVVGVASYGRSFKMAEAGCTGPTCKFTGSPRVSNAAKGRCTDTAGYISNAEIGEVVAPLGASTTSRGAVVLIADMNSLLVEADVSESNIEKIEVNRDCEIVLDAYPDKNYAGFVFKIVPTADRSKATVMVKVGFKNYDSRVLPEMSAKVLFLNEALDPLTADQKLVLVVPFSSIKQEAGKTLVYFVNNDIVEPLSISTGKRLGNNIEVTSGLQRGDKIIESVDEYITQGIKVKILN